MSADVTIPRLGWSMEEGVFAGWLKQPGDAVRPGEPLFMLEGEKATQEIEAVDGGTLHLAPDAPSPGDTVLVGRVIAKLCGSGEVPSWLSTPRPTHARPATPASPPPTSPARTPAAGDGGSSSVVPRFTASPSVRRLARRMGIDLATVVPRLPGGRLSAGDLDGRFQPELLKTHSPSDGRSTSSPRARRLAHERGIDIRSLAGSGAGGRVRARDVLAAATANPPALSEGWREVPISQTRRTIARQMLRSRQETVPVTLTAWADATALLASRAAEKLAHGQDAATLNDMLLSLVAVTLLEHPLLAARWAESHLAVPDGRIDIGLAVDAPGGLVVPVVRDVNAASIDALARQTRDLVKRAREGRLTAADMQGGAFTLTSLGSYGVEFFTPVINYPETAILGVGAIRLLPVELAEAPTDFRLRQQLPLSLTFDHRVVDGGPAARFLQDLSLRIGRGLGGPAAGR